MNKSIMGLALASLLGASQVASALTVGFSQVGSESGWRTTFSESVKAEADKRGIDLKFSDAQQKQENQIKAIRSFIAQGVDAIVVAPVVETGWRPVLMEARRARIPVVIVDRNVAVNNDQLYVTRIAPNFVDEGRKAANWLMDATDGQCDIVELQGTVGSSAAIGRMEGFNEVIGKYEGAKIVRSQTAEFTRAKGKEVMESILKAEGGGKELCALWTHNDEMALGAIQAIREAGLKPGEDILVVSVDAVDDIFSALKAGDVNASVEMSPHLGGPAFDVIEAYLDGKRDFEKWMVMDGRIFTQENYQDEYELRKSQ
ncbi:ABC transporter substrate-binding protein [Gilvimarinus sp. SDUM040013]|uniref:ABC transporter substrate-binding protein n=1 Tax=Gilvimarinus gilvus TaxID=3058038 RepID=A0ABU4RVS7_9GAMM|nr:ABC transporter substrate-binding protein [Gilvimarinus sp. SDUM040013]MDO3387273.1 ABC transporter substrate-binding protein [Gilvimarinus sp. SDUM040013]MDX6848962.1 ABC transporter substrate-binding protein [Gilvimarinus sp. SDUM040013]